MSKKILLLVFIFLCLGIFTYFTSCTQEGNLYNITNVIEDAEEETEDFTSEAVPFCDLTGEAKEALYVRFYEGNEYIPYIYFKYAFSIVNTLINNFSSVNSTYSDGKYTYKIPYHDKECSFILDSKNDKIYTYEWFGFKERYNLEYNLLKIVESFTGQKKVEYDLAEYGFEVYGGIDDAYIPISLINIILLNRYQAAIIYTGEEFILKQDYSLDYNDILNSSLYQDENGKFKDRSKELIDYSYNLLRFNHDYFYGHPGYYGFADDGSGIADEEIVKDADSLKFDALLEKYDKETKEKLKSTSYRDYLEGLMRLYFYDYGDSHAFVDYQFYLSAFSDIKIEDFYTYFGEILSKKNLNSLKNHKSLEEKKTEAGKEEGLELIEGGKTAIIRFEEFKNPSSDWKNYLTQTNIQAMPKPELTEDEIKAGKIAVPDDTLGFFYRSIYTIINNPDYKNVKNVIIDLSLNGGGAADTCYFILSYLIEDLKVYFEDVHSKTVYCEIVKADLNLDGKVDQADDLLRNYLLKKTYTDENGLEKSDGRGLNFAILTSFGTFSAGNVFANVCKQAGFPIIGQQSGGGSCAVSCCYSMEGIFCQYSYCFRNINSNGKSVENGIEVTKNLSYDQFYDDSELQKVMDELFGE